MYDNKLYNIYYYNKYINNNMIISLKKLLIMNDLQIERF